MAITTSSSISNTIQAKYSKDLLKHAVQLTVLEQAAMKKSLPTKSGVNSIRFYRPLEADASRVYNLQEGSPLSSYTTLTYTAVDVTLTQVGEIVRYTDIASYTELFDVLKDGIRLMGEDAALKFDGRLRDCVVAGITGTGQKRYGNNIASFNVVAASTGAAAAITAKDLLMAVTQLRLQRAPEVNGGGYLAFLEPRGISDLFRDADILNASVNYKDDVLFKGEVKNVYGARIVQHTNPWIEYSTNGTEGTCNASGNIYTGIVCGQDAFGCVDLAGAESSKSYMKPSVIINDKADKTDPLNQYITAGWKAYYGEKVLNANWACTIRYKTTHV